MQAQSHFTPEQLIVAGRRAEAQGQPAYALQFYRYVAENFGASTEAYEARDAIYRLTPHGDAQGQAPAAAMAAPAASAPTMDVRPGAVLDSGSGQGRAAVTRKPEARKRRQDAEVEASASDDTGGPAYRIGRFVATVLSTIGWLLLLGGILMGPLVAAALTVKSLQKGLRDGIASNLLVVGGATFGMIFLGLFAVFAAQAARATFDTADAVRHMLYGHAGDHH